MKVRSPALPQSEKSVRSWEADGWSYELCQRSNGNYTVYAVEDEGPGWAIESAPTVKACLAAVRQTPAEMDALLEVAE